MSVTISVTTAFFSRPLRTGEAMAKVAHREAKTMEERILTLDSQVSIEFEVVWCLFTLLEEVTYLYGST